MRERVFRFGPDHNLLCVVTPPADSPRPVGLIILNAGVLHRVGPHRIGVKIARHVARRGYTAVRLDLAGLGDSPFPPDPAPHPQQSVLDARAVMDELEHNFGLERFALFGICSGAEKAYLTAIADERVAGAFLMDGFSYPTLEGRLIHLAARLRSLTPAKAIAKIRRMGSERRLRATRIRSNAAEGVLPHPPHAQFAADMNRLIERGVHVTLLYSANAPVRYAQQMHDAFGRFGFMRHVECRYLPDTNHIVTLLAAQERVLAMIDGWLDAFDPASADAGDEGQARLTSKPPR